MKKKWIFLIVAIVFAGLIAGAVVLYNGLGARYEDMLEKVEEPKENIVVQENHTDKTETVADMAPNFAAVNDKGRAVELKDYFGKPIVLNFWATWCGPCKMELPYFNEAYLEYGTEIEFVMLNLTDGFRETVKSVRKFMSDNGYEFPVHFDTQGDGAATYGAYSIPMTVFIDEKGMMQGKYVGVIPEDVFWEHIEALRGE